VFEQAKTVHGLDRAAIVNVITIMFRDSDNVFCESVRIFIRISVYWTGEDKHKERKL
jgi:hypothetical protein